MPWGCCNPETMFSSSLHTHPLQVGSDWAGSASWSGPLCSPAPGAVGRCVLAGRWKADLCTALLFFSHPHLPSLWGLSPSSGPWRSGSGTPWEQRACSLGMFSERLWNTLVAEKCPVSESCVGLRSWQMLVIPGGLSVL